MGRILQAAEALIVARSTNEALIEYPNKSEPTSVDDAFAIQDAVLEKTEAKIGAWKVGPATSSFPATCAVIPSDNVIRSPASLPNTLRLKAVECEVAFRLSMDLPADRGPYTSDDVKASIATAMVAIEAVETRYNTWPVPDPIWALADSQSNEALIIGEETDFLDNVDIGGLRANFTIDNENIPASKGFPGGDPFSLIAWLAEHLSSRAPVISKRGLKKGDIVTTGSWNGVDFARNNSTVTAEFENLGVAHLTYVTK
ncbi:MAG: hypothetical protein CMM58_11985 [Rhodospirillaceae bacterium]|nr:hypothetical protein [Rhodospirillaceae bacterium]